MRNIIDEVKSRFARALKDTARIKRGQKDIVGVDISEDRITVVVVNTSAVLTVKDFAVKKISVPQRDEEISMTIGHIFAERRLFKKEVWLNIDSPEPQLAFKRLSLPVMPDSEVPAAIRWNMKDRVPSDIKAAQLAYEIIGEAKNEDGSVSLNILAAAAQKGLIDRFLNIFKKAGIPLAGINVTPFSIANILRLDKGMRDQEEPILVCHIGAAYSCLCVYVNNKLDFVRQIPLAEQNFLNGMIGVLGSDKGKIELTAADAKAILEEFGIPKEKDVILGGKVAPSQIMAMVRPVMERIADEISRSIEYYQSEFNTAKIKRVLLTGEGAYIKGLNEFISKEMSVKTENLRLPDDRLICGAAIGAAAGDVSEINLLPDELKQAKQEEIKKTVLRVSTAAALSLLFFSFISVSIQIASYRKELVLVRSQRVLLNDLKTMKENIGAITSVSSFVRAREVPVDVILQEVSAAAPFNIAFSELSIEQGQKILRLKGRVSSQPEATQGVLSDFMEQLQKFLFIKGADLISVQREGAGAAPAASFEISCRLER